MDNQKLLVSELGTFGHKNTKFGESWILYMYTVGPQCKMFNNGFTGETNGGQMTAFW